MTRLLNARTLLDYFDVIRRLLTAARASSSEEAGAASRPPRG
jgi:hypothetical protein